MTSKHLVSGLIVLGWGILLAGCGFSKPVTHSHHHSHRNPTAASQPIGSVTVISNIQSFQMLNSQTGWLLTQHTLYHLTHGGRDATKVQASANEPLAATWSNGHVYTARVLGQHHDEIKIQSSTNEGLSWSSLATIHSPYPPKQIILHPNGMGWLQTSPGPAGAEMPAQLWRTSNDGRHWTLVARFPIREDIVNDQPQILINGGQFQFLSSNQGWLIPFPSPAADQTFLYHTTTGGHTWLPVDMPSPAGRISTDMLDISALVTNARGNGLVMVQWGSKTNTWQAASMVNHHIQAWGTPMTGGSNPVFATTTSPTAIWMANNHTLWSITTNAAPKPTSKHVTTHLPFTSPTALQMSSRQGWALSLNNANHPMLWTATDGGVHWHRVT